MKNSIKLIILQIHFGYGYDLPFWNDKYNHKIICKKTNIKKVDTEYRKGLQLKF